MGDPSRGALGLARSKRARRRRKRPCAHGGGIAAPAYRSILQVFSVPIAQEVAGTARLKFLAEKAKIRC